MNGGTAWSSALTAATRASWVLRTWRFRFYSVSRLECPRCHGVFNYYQGVSPKGKRSEFVIRVRPKPKAKAPQP